MVKSKRVKPKEIKPLRDLSEADDALFRIAQLRLELKRIDAEAETAINEIKEKAGREAQPILEEIKRLENGVFAFSEYNRDMLFLNKKTIELNFGFLGYRKGRDRITVKKTTVDKLKALGRMDAIIVKESANKEVLITFPDELLRQVDAKRVKGKDEFWYEVKEEAVTENISV
ncbi:MAG: hypothetical protein Kow0037_00980 [Calditrichia bacterium]